MLTSEQIINLPLWSVINGSNGLEIKSHTSGWYLHDGAKAMDSYPYTLVRYGLDQDNLTDDEIAALPSGSKLIGRKLIHYGNMVDWMESFPEGTRFKGTNCHRVKLDGKWYDLLECRPTSEWAYDNYKVVK